MTREEQQDLLEQAIRYIEEEDMEKAEACLLRAAEAGLPEAMHHYACYLLYEKKDIPAAADWYEKCYRSGHEFDLRGEYRESSDAFRAAIDARFTAEEKKALRIQSQAIYDTMARLFFVLFICGVGAAVGRCFTYLYAEAIGLGIGALVSACLWNRISFSRMVEFGKK